MTDLATNDLDTVHLLEQRPINWIEDNCWIEPKKPGGAIPFRLNDAQLIILKVIERLRAMKRPVRLIILKARQRGVTTFGLAYQYRRACTRQSHHAMMASHKGEASAKIFDKVKLFQNRNPQARPSVLSNRKELQFVDPHRSTLWAATAGSDDLGRSGTLDDFHGTEVAIWPDAAAALNAVMACIPKEEDNWDTTVILESTAKGVGGEFFKRWKAAVPYAVVPYMKMPKGVEGESAFIAIFLPWHTEPSYRHRAPRGFVPSEEEKRLAALYDLDHEQLQWRRLVIKDDCGGDEAMFNQEYPSCDRDAFVTSGRSVFSDTAMDNMETACRLPHLMGRMIEGADGPTCESGGVEWLEVWEHPHEGELYAIGADTAEGKDPEESDNPDAHSAHVIRVATNTVVAKMSGRFDPDIFGTQLDLLGRWYNDALLGPEVNNTSGGSVRSTLKRLNYPNMYYKEILTRDIDKDTDTLGWYTDLATRGQLVTELIAAIRNRRMWVFSEQTVYQLRCWVWDRNGKATHPPGEHDDDVMSLGIAWQMAAVASMVGAKDIEDETGMDGDSGNGFTSDMLIGGREQELEEDDGDWVDDEAA